LRVRYKLGGKGVPAQTNFVSAGRRKGNLQNSEGNVLRSTRGNRR